MFELGLRQVSCIYLLQTRHTQGLLSPDACEGPECIISIVLCLNLHRGSANASPQDGWWTSE